MTLNRRSRLGCTLFLLIVLSGILGCGDETNSPTAVKLKGIANMYVDAAFNRYKNVGPPNETAFKSYLKGQPDHVLGSHGFKKDAIDASFVSERDNEPFVIIYGIKITGISGKEGPVVAHEKTGRGGRYLVSLTNGKVLQVDEAGLKELKEMKELKSPKE